MTDIEASGALLTARGIRKTYSGVTALDDVGIEVDAGSITGLIGPNGSGKSTLFDCICGFQAMDAGSVLFDGQDLHGLPPHRIARLGLRRTFQQLRVFPELSLRQNLLTAAQAAPDFPYLSELLRTPAVRRHEQEMAQRASGILAETRLARLSDTLAGGLSYGQKKLLELGMALMSEPRLLLLDEPMAGVNPTLIDSLKEELLRVNRRGVTLLVVEHNLKLIFEISDCIYVLEQGRVLMRGTPEQVAGDEAVIQAYLGRPRASGYGRDGRARGGAS